MFGMDIEAEVNALAARQHGAFTRGQGRRMGLTRAQERSRLRTARWSQPYPRVFVVAGAPQTWEQRVMVAVLAAGPAAVASHVTAGAIWAFPDLDQFPLPVEVTTTRPPRVRLPRVRVHRSVVFLAQEHTVKNGIAVTSPARTLVDMSAFWSVSQLGRATDYAMRKLFMRLDDLRCCNAGLAPAPGRRPSRIKAVLSQRLPGYNPGESGLEMRVLRAIVAHGLPEPVQQHEVRLPDRLCRIDFAYPEYKIAIEVDSWEFHGPRSAFEPDRARGNDVAIAHWLPLHFTSESTDARIGIKTEEALRSRGWCPGVSAPLGR
jgi:hypothetical protein